MNWRDKLKQQTQKPELTQVSILAASFTCKDQNHVLTVIKDLRSKAGLKSYDIAHVLSITPAAYSLLESGKSNLTVNQLLIILNHLKANLTINT